MALRVVLYTEGPREGGLIVRGPRAPGTPIGEEELGPGHILTQRLLVDARHLNQDEIAFERPLLNRGREVRGSELYHKGTLRRLLTWPRSDMQPDLAVVLVDRNNDKFRRRKLQTFLGDLLVPVALGVAVKEFETWLLADTKAVSAALGRTVPSSSRLETLEAREAKSIFLEITKDSDRATIRRAIALGCDLDVVRKRCKSFERFWAALRG